MINSMNRQVCLFSVSGTYGPVLSSPAATRERMGSRRHLPGKVLTSSMIHTPFRSGPDVTDDHIRFFLLKFHPSVAPGRITLASFGSYSPAKFACVHFISLPVLSTQTKRLFIKCPLGDAIHFS